MKETKSKEIISYLLKYIYSIIYNRLPPPLFFFFLVFRAASTACGNSQLTAEMELQPKPQQHRIQAKSVTYITAHSNTGYLIH